MAALLPFKLSLKDGLKAAFDTICMLVTDDKLHRRVRVKSATGGV